MSATTDLKGLSYCDLLLETFVCFFVSTVGHYMEYVEDGMPFKKKEFCKATFSESLKMFLTW